MRAGVRRASGWSPPANRIERRTRVGRMRALAKTSRGPGLELVQVPEPTPGPDDVKIRVLRTGTRGTDLHLDDWDAWAAGAVDAPMTLGHEFSGVVAEVGAT